METTSYVFSFLVVFFYLVTTGWIFFTAYLCENSINQSINNINEPVAPVVQVVTSKPSEVGT